MKELHRIIAVFNGKKMRGDVSTVNSPNLYRCRRWGGGGGGEDASPTEDFVSWVKISQIVYADKWQVVIIK